MHPIHLVRRPLSAIVFGVFGLCSAQAQTSGDAPPAQSKGSVTQASSDQLDPVTVTATRTGTAASRTAASVSVITSQDLEEQQAENIKDALRYEPGVTVRRAAYRPTSAATAGGRDENSSINIRGLEGNRILLMEDGIRLPSAFSFGPIEAGRGDYTDLGTLRRIEILRGPASTLYGSDGLTGAVNFITKDPQDLLDIYGKKTYFSVRPTYESADRSFGSTLTAAGGNEMVQAMVIADGQRGHELDNHGSNNSIGVNRSTANPQNTYTESLLGKIVVKPSAHDTFKFTVENVRERIDTNVLSAINPPITLALTDNDRLERNRYSLDYDFHNTDSPFFQTAHVQFYYQDASQNQDSNEIRGISPSRTRNNQYQERVIGGSTFAESTFHTGILTHKLLYGGDGSLDHVTNLRDGTIPGAGEPPFPNKAFPDSDYTLLGAFVQDQISYGALTVTPGLRFDRYQLSTKSGDPLYLGTPVSMSDNALSPRLAVLYEVSPALIPYVQYAHGFRAPSSDQVNNSFANPLYGYTSIGNPNLKPETSDTFEVGLSGKLGTDYGPVHYSAAAFTGHYRDFISQQIVSGSGRPTDPLVFQYVNYAQAYIHGLEGRAEWVLPNGISLKTAMAFTRGSVDNSGKVSQPLDTINPFSAVFGIRYEPSERWFTQADLLFQATKKSSDITANSCNSSTCFAPPSSFIVDLSGGYRVTKHAMVYLGVFNLFNRKYWNWSDVRGIADSSVIKDAYTAPGRNVSVSMKLDF